MEPLLIEPEPSVPSTSNPQCLKPKRKRRSAQTILQQNELTRREEARARAGWTEEIGPVVSIAHILKGIGEPECIDALRGDDSEEAQKFIAKFDSISESDRSYLKTEEIAALAGINARSLVQTITGALFTQSAEASKAIVLANQPRVTQKMISMALTDRGEKDREMYLRGTGFIPVPKGAQTTINLNQQNNTQQLPAQASNIPLVLGSTDDLLLDMQSAIRPQLTAGEATNVEVPVNAPDLEYIDADV